MLYESMIFTKGMDSMLDLQSGLFCFLGSQGVGKTYTVSGQLSNVWDNSGMLGCLMQDVFQDSIAMQNQGKQSSSNNAVELRFLQILGDNVENIGFETVYGESTHERQLANRIDYKIDIKSLTHFQNCINKIYERKKPQMHLVIEVTLKNQPLIYTTKKTTLTFIQISSACFDEGNVHAQKIKTQVQALITIFQNIQRIKHLEHLFETSKLTKLLKYNFFEAKNICLIGILDNSFKGNSITLKWLKTALQLKEDKTIIQSMKEDIKKQEDYLKSLMEKHKKAMTLLSKCIGAELSFLQKQKTFATSKRQIQFGFGNSLNKRCEKIKLANIKKQENQEQIQKLNKQISALEQDIDFMEFQQKELMKKLQEERNEIICVKNKLITKMEEIAQQLAYRNMFSPGNGRNIVGNNTTSSLYWRPGIDFDPISHPNERRTQEAFADKKNENMENQSGGRKDCTSCNSSVTKISIKKITNNQNIRNNYSNSKPFIPTSPSITKIERKKIDQQQNQQNFLLEAKREQTLIKKQTKRQIYQLFKGISEQQKQLSIAIKQYHQNLTNFSVNKIKNRQSYMEMNSNKMEKQLIQSYLKDGKQFDGRNYVEFVRNQNAFVRISKNLLSKQKKTQQSIITNNES